MTGTGWVLAAVNPNSSCERIKQTGGANGSGYYMVDSDGNGEVRTYCDFDGTWWVASSFPDETVPYNTTQTKVRSAYFDLVTMFPEFNFNEDIPFTLSWEGNPTVSINGTLTRGTSGVIRDGTNIEVDTPPVWGSYTATVTIPGHTLSFTAIRWAAPEVVLDLDFWTQTVNYAGRIFSAWKNLPTLENPTPFTLSWGWNPTAQTSGGGQAASGNISYGTQIQADAPSPWQTRVIEITVMGQTGTFTIIRQ